MHLDAAVPVERRHPPVLLQAPRLDRQLDQAALLQAGGQAGLGFQPLVQVAGVLAQLGRGLRRRAERRHQAGRVPGRARGQPVALEQQDVLHAQLREVIRDRGADDPAADHDHLGAVRQLARGTLRLAGPGPLVTCLVAGVHGHAAATPMFCGDGVGARASGIMAVSRGSACGRSPGAGGPPRRPAARSCSSRRTRSCPRTRTSSTRPPRPGCGWRSGPGTTGRGW